MHALGYKVLILHVNTETLNQTYNLKKKKKIFGFTIWSSLEICMYKS